MWRSLLLLWLLRSPQAPPETAAPETVVIECPGLRCAACQLGVLRESKGLRGVRSVDFDPARSRLSVKVDPGFDRHHELIVAVQRSADPIEMFRAVLVEPRQVFLYVDGPLTSSSGDALVRAVSVVPGVKSVFRDERGVLSIAMSESTNRAAIVRCARALGFRPELFETRYETNRGARVSEFSHHAIGVLLLVLSFLLIADRAAGGTRPALGAVIPGVWILAGLLVLILSDLDSWPFVRTLGDTLKDKMIVQHKVLALGMILLGVAEAAHRRGRGWRYGPVTCFLGIAAASGIMLQSHFPDMVDPAHLQAWKCVDRQHLAAAVVGGAALLCRAASEYGLFKRPAFAFAWPALVGVEGALLCLFFEPVW